MRASHFLMGTAMTVALVPAAAFGQATDEEAEAIRQGIRGWIEQNNSSPEIRVDISGPIEVTPSGTSYEVVFPRTDLILGGEGHVIFDFVQVTLVPTGDGLYNATWAIPEHYAVLDNDGDEQGVITLRKQFGTGLFAPQYETFLSIDANLEGLVVTPHDHDGELSIGEISMVGNSEDLGDGTFDSTFSVALGDLAFTDDNDHFDLGLLSLEGAFDALDMDRYFDFVQAFNALMESEANAGRSEPSPDFFDRLAELVERTPKLLDATSFEYVMRDLSVVDGRESVDIGEIVYGMSVDGLRGTESTVALNLSASDIMVDPAPPEFQYAPQETVIDLSLEQLPNDRLLVILLDFLRSSAQMGPDNAVLMAASQLQQAAMEGGSTLQIEEISAVSDLYSVMLQGEVVPRADAAFGATAEAFMEFGGMPELIGSLQAVPEAQPAVQGLTVLQGLGQQGTDDEGREVRVYEFELQPDGKMLLNGTDLQPLLGAMMQ